MKPISETRVVGERSGRLPVWKITWSRGKPLDEAGGRRAAAFLRYAYWLAWRFHHQRGWDLPIDELKAEACYALTYAASMFREELGVPFGAYLTRLVRHRLVFAARRWRRLRQHEVSVWPGRSERDMWDAHASPLREASDAAARQELHDRVRRMLPPHLYKVLYQHHAEGKTLDSIGQDLGVSRQRVRQLVAQAQRRVRRYFPEWANPA